MKIIDNILCNISNESFYDRVCKGRGLFLDIETTGLKRDSSCIYLIGMLYPLHSPKEEGYRLTLLFAEDPEEEILILKEFCRITKDTGLFPITFNGRRFDLPFIKERCRIHGVEIPDILDSGEDLDIYARIKPYRRSFSLSSLNQKSVERMLGIEREDKYTGGELISVYHEYVKSRDDELLDLLITHNREDVLGMTEILPVLSYSGIFELSPETEDPEIRESFIESHEGYDGETVSELIIVFSLPSPVPKPHLFHNMRLFLETRDDLGTLRIPLFKGELKHFFSNYRDYFYIPSEDRAVLKEIAGLMNNTEKERAKVSNCYIRTSGLFLPLPQDFTDSGFTVYKTDYRSRTLYAYLNDDIKKSPALKEYLLQVLGKCFK